VTNRLENSRNLTILNAVLAVTGPLHEQTLTNVVVVIQTLCCAAAFFVRFTMAGLVYEAVM
jgi:UDP-N-acetylglucosamine--dolichyl-phosphate N-acetylglucosaminephosphotransferase